MGQEDDLHPRRSTTIELHTVMVLDNHDGWDRMFDYKKEGQPHCATVHSPNLSDAGPCPAKPYRPGFEGWAPRDSAHRFGTDAIPLLPVTGQ